jgi:hypothetical protein
MEEKHWIYSHIGCKMNYSSHHEPQNETYTLTLDNIEEAIEFGDTIAEGEVQKLSKEESEGNSKRS